MDQEPTRTGFAAALRRSRWLVLAVAFTGLGAAGAAALVLPRSWASTATLDVTAARPVSAEEFAADVGRLSSQMASPSALEKVVAELKLDRGDGAPPETDAEALMAHRTEVAASLAAATSIRCEPTGETSCRLHVRLGAREPSTARLALERLLAGHRAEIYDRPRQLQEEILATARTAAEQAEARAGAAAAELAAWEQANADFLGDIEQQAAEVQSSIRRIEDTDILEAKRAKSAAEEVLQNEEPTRRETVRNVDPAVAAALDARIAEVESVLRDLTEVQKRADADPEVRTAREAAAALRRQRADLDRNAPETVQVRENPLYAECVKRRDEAAAAILVAERQLASFRKNERMLQDKLRKVPEVRAARERLAGGAESARQELAARRAEVTAAEEQLAKLAEARRLDLRVSEPPRQPDSPAGAPPALLALGGLSLGAAAGAALARILDARDRSFREVDAVAGVLGVPTLGAIPVVTTPDEAAQARRQTVRKAAAVAVLGCAAAGIAGWSVLAPSGGASSPAPQEANR